MAGTSTNRLLKWLIAGVLICSSMTAFAQPEIFIFNTSTGEPYTTPDHQGFQDLIVQEVFKRTGRQGRVEKYEASARALINANQGIDQGVAMRIRGLEKHYPNLVRIDEPLIRNDFVAYSTGREVPTDNWSSLKPYIVAYIHGWVIFERNLVPGQRKHSVRKADQMFAMLRKGRVDLALYERWQGLQEAKSQGVSVKILEPPLASVDMYMYIHKEFSELAPGLAQALRDMKSDGTYQAIFDRTLNVLLR